jgi:hypothetical protein
MSPKTIFKFWIIATVISLLGVQLFISKSVGPVFSRSIMLVGILLSLVWIGGLISLAFRKLFRR